MKFYRAHLHHFLSALAFIAKLLIYLKWKKKSQRKEKQAFVGVWQCFPYMLSPWVRVHPVYWHILQTCTNLWGKAVGVHSPVTWKTPRETREKTIHPRNYHIGHTFPALFSQDISMLLIFLHSMKTAYVLESSSLVLDILEQLWCLCRGCNYNNHNQHCPVCPAALLLRLGNTGLSKPEKWFKLRGSTVKSQWLFLQNATAGHIYSGIKCDSIWSTLSIWTV